MQDKFKLGKKQDLDNLVDLIRKGDWKAADFLYRKSKRYCWKIYREKFHDIPEDEVESIICFSVGKTMATYKICGKYLALLAKIFVNDIYDYLKPKMKEKKLGKRVDYEEIHQRDGDYGPTKREFEILFYKALSMKPKDHKECIQLVLDGFSDEQIKNVLGTKKSIKDLKYHSKVNLKRVLIKKFGWEKKK